MADINDIKINDEMLANALKNALKGFADPDYPELTKNLIEQNTKEFKDTFNKELKKLKFAELNKKLENELLSSIKKEFKTPQGFWQSFFQKRGFSEKRDSLESRYASDQISRGLSYLSEGRFLSGITEVLKANLKVANFMGGPYYATMVAAAKVTESVINSLNRFEVATNRLAGNQDTKGTRYKKNFEIKAFANMYNQKEEDYIKYVMSDLGQGAKRKYYEDSQFTNTYYSMRAGLEQVGADPNKANSIISQQLSLGRTGLEIRKFNYELIKATKTMDIFSSDKFLNTYEELNKTLMANNINGMANAKTLAQFQDALNKGTLAASDFTRGLTSRRSAETSTLAGVGAMLAERGLGTKELRDAYNRGDMIAVAGAMRRGGNKISRDIEKIAPELAKQFGTTDIREAIAMQAGSPWGQLGPDLKKLEVQNILAAGGSLTIGTTANKPLTDEELQNINKAEHDLIDESIRLKGAFQAVSESAMLLAAYLAKEYEQTEREGATMTNITNNPSAAIISANPYQISAPVKVVNPSQLNN